MSLEQLGNAALTAFIFFALFILGYCYISKKSLMEVFNEIKEIFASKKEEVLG